MTVDNTRYKPHEGLSIVKETALQCKSVCVIYSLFLDYLVLKMLTNVFLTTSLPMAATNWAISVHYNTNLLLLNKLLLNLV